MPSPGKSLKLKVSQYLGVSVIPKQLHRINPSWRAILAYYAIAYYAHNGTRSVENMTVKSLAKIAAVSESTMLRGLNELERKGAISVRSRSRKSATGNKIPLANLYECRLAEIEGDPI